MRKTLRSPITWTLVVIVAAAGLYWFQPHTLFIDAHVNEQLPPVVLEEPREATGEVLLAEGEFVSQEHDTVGSADLVKTAEGDIVLAMSGLETSNGPDLRVWLTDQSVDPDEWFVFDDGYYAELGELRGNIGDQVYQVPADVDLDRVTSVSIWCARFAVSFGAAELG